MIFLPFIVRGSKQCPWPLINCISVPICNTVTLGSSHQFPLVLCVRVCVCVCMCDCVCFPAPDYKDKHDLLAETSNKLF